jgi:hypothetical protein
VTFSTTTPNMKSEDELLAELRSGLAAFAASAMKMERVESRDFPLVDIEFYNGVAGRIVNCGFSYAGDFVPRTGHQSDGSMRCFIRAFLSNDAPYTAACYHPRPRFWIGLLSRVLCGRLGKVVEIETELSDDTWIITTTAPKARLFDPPPLILREHHPEKIGVEELLECHRGRVQTYLKADPSLIARRVRDVAGLERSQARQHDITAVYRAMVGGLTADEIRRFSVFGRVRSAELKKRLDAIGTGANQ